MKPLKVLEFFISMYIFRIALTIFWHFSFLDLIKGILLDVGFIKEIITAWVTKKGPKIFFQNSFYLRYYVSIRLTAYQWQPCNSHFKHHKRGRPTVDPYWQCKTTTGSNSRFRPIKFFRFRCWLLTAILSYYLPSFSLREFFQKYAFCDATNWRNAGFLIVRSQTD